jgi:hypothetical protein
MAVHCPLPAASPCRDSRTRHRGYYVPSTPAAASVAWGPSFMAESSDTSRKLCSTHSFVCPHSRLSATLKSNRAVHTRPSIPPAAVQTTGNPCPRPYCRFACVSRYHSARPFGQARALQRRPFHLAQPPSGLQYPQFHFWQLGHDSAQMDHRCCQVPPRTHACAIQWHQT